MIKALADMVGDSREGRPRPSIRLPIGHVRATRGDDVEIDDRRPMEYRHLHLVARPLPKKDHRPSDYPALGWTAEELACARTKPTIAHALDGTLPLIEVVGIHLVVRDCVVDRRLQFSVSDATLEIIDSMLDDGRELSWFERTTHSDGSTSSIVSADVFEGARLTGDSPIRPTKEEEQAVVAERVVRCINGRSGTHYVALPENPPQKGETRDYPDARLISSVPAERELWIQVRHLHDTIAGRLRGPSHRIEEFDVEDLAVHVQAAIDDKAVVDEDVKRRTHLALLYPIGLGQIRRSKLCATTFYAHGFLDVWCCPFREKPFSLIY